MPATPDAAAITPPADNSASSAPDVPAPAPAPPKKPALRIGDKVEVIDKKVIGCGKSRVILPIHRAFDHVITSALPTNLQDSSI